MKRGTNDELATRRNGERMRGDREDRLRFPPLAGRKRKGWEGGQELVEYALVFPLLFLLFFGLIEVGIAIHARQAIANAARAGARAGIVNPSPAAIRTAVCTELRSSAVPCSAVTIVPTITKVAERDWIEVKVTYPLTLTTGMVIRALGVSPRLSLRAVWRMPIE